MMIHWDDVSDLLALLAGITSERSLAEHQHDIDELLCQLFDDTGLGYAIEKQKLPEVLDNHAKELLVKLYELNTPEKHSDTSNSQTDDWYANMSSLSKQILEKLKGVRNYISDH